MDIGEIKQLMDELEASKLHKIVYKKGDFEIQLEKQVASVPVAPIAASPVVPPPSAASPAEKEPEGNFVTSPMVGTFYTASGPDQAPFVKVGDTVTEETVVCIVEAMKVMNEVKAEISGTVAEILPKNGQAVEFGARLFRVVP